MNWESLPARVEGIIGERISRLPSMLQAMLQVASVEGEVFTAEVLAQAQDVDEADTVWQLSRILDRQHRLVRVVSSQRLGIEGQRLSRYRFRHILFQKYLYGRMDEAERGYLHETVGTVLEQIYEGRTEEVAVQLAHHFQTAGLTLKAIDYLCQAGDRAVRLSANEESLTHFYKGLALLETMPQTPEHLRQELAIQIALFAPLVAAKGYAAPEVGQAYARARVLGKQVGDSKQVFWITLGLWGHNLVIAQMEPTRGLAERSLVLARHIQEPAQLMEAYRMLDETSFHCGEFVAARKYHELGLPLYDPQQHRAHAAIHGQDPGVAYLSHGSWILWHLGLPDQALKMGHEAVISGEESSHPFSLGYALCYTAVLHQLLNDEQMTEKLASAAITLSSDHVLVVWLAIANILRGWAVAVGGQRQEGIALMQQGLADWRSMGAGLHVPYFLTLLATEYTKDGKVDAGLKLLDEANAFVNKGGERHFEAEIYRLRAEFLQIRGEAEPVVYANLVRAIDIARRQAAKSLELRSTVTLCRMLQQQGRASEARQMLTEIYDWFTEGFDTADLKEAKALLDSLKL